MIKRRPQDARWRSVEESHALFVQSVMCICAFKKIGTVSYSSTTNETCT
jgi:hypothetical protein